MQYTDAAGSNKTDIKGSVWTNRIRTMFKQRYLYAMVMPAFICILVFNYLPLAGWLMAFKNYQTGLSLWKAEWIGLEQFRTFFVESSDFIYVIKNTLVMNVGSLVVNMFIAVTFAILLKELRVPLFSKTIQTVSFFPFFISFVTVYSIFNVLFAVNSGAINDSLMSLGILKEPINVLGDEKYSWLIIILMNAWKSTGYNTIIFLSTIASIPAEEYEVANIEGAGRFQTIFYVTLPNLMPTIVVLLIMNSGWIFSSNLEQFFLFTNPTNWSTMEVFDMYIYKFGLKQLNYSYATAVGIIKSLVSIALLMGVNTVAKRVNGKSIL